MPAHWHLETGNALIMALRRHRLSHDQLNEALHAIKQMNPEVDDETLQHAHGATTRLAEKHKLTLYDAAYLELAIRLNGRLLTLDKALQVAADQSGVLWHAIAS